MTPEQREELRRQIEADSSFHGDAQLHQYCRLEAALLDALDAGPRATRATAKGTTIDVDEWDRPLYVLDAGPRSEEGLREAARKLADEAARAVTEPRRFHENEDDRQHELSSRVAIVRAALRTTEETPDA